VDGSVVVEQFPAKCKMANWLKKLESLTIIKYDGIARDSALSGRAFTPTVLITEAKAQS
jgi:hypothetical protein